VPLFIAPAWESAQGAELASAGKMTSLTKPSAKQHRPRDRKRKTRQPSHARPVALSSVEGDQAEQCQKRAQHMEPLTSCPQRMSNGIRSNKAANIRCQNPKHRGEHASAAERGTSHNVKRPLLH
jgi:hypothetical protein